MYYPVSKEIKDGDVIYIGKIGPSHTLRVILNAEEPLPITDIRTDAASNVTIASGRAWVEMNAPPYEGAWRVCFDVERSDGLNSFCLTMDVTEDILYVDVDEINVGEFSSTTFNVYVQNKGVGYTDIKVFCKRCGFKEKRIYSHETVSVSLLYSGGVWSYYEEPIFVKDMRSGKEFTTKTNVYVYPTVEGRIYTSKLFPGISFPILDGVRVIWRLVLWRM